VSRVSFLPAHEAGQWRGWGRTAHVALLGPGQLQPSARTRVVWVRRCAAVGCTGLTSSVQGFLPSSCARNIVVSPLIPAG
jgi:hypothetical protein